MATNDRVLPQVSVKKKNKEASIACYISPMANRKRRGVKHSLGWDATRLTTLLSSCDVHHVESLKTKFEG